jgi:hypothetical protein
MRRSIVLSLLLVLVTIGSATLDRPGAGWAQGSPEARPPSEANIEIIGEMYGEGDDALTLLNVSLDPGKVMRVYPDDPYWATFEVTEGMLIISVTEGQVTLVQNRESRILEAGTAAELGATDVIFAVGAQYEITNLAPGDSLTQDAQRNLAQPDATGTAKLIGAAKGCRSFCLGP